MLVTKSNIDLFGPGLWSCRDTSYGTWSRKDGDGDDDDDGDAPKEQKRRRQGSDLHRVRGSDIVAQFAGDPERLGNRVADLQNENADYRDDLREAKAKIAELKAKVPVDGSVVLTAEQAADWKTYQDLGAPKDLQSKLEKASKDTVELTTRRRNDHLREVAEGMGWKFNALKRLSIREDGTPIDFEVKEEKDDQGTTSKVWYAKEGDNLIPLSQFAESNWEDFLPSLQGGGSNDRQSTPPPTGSTAGKAKPFPGQGTGTARRQDGGTPDIVGSYISGTYGPKKTSDQGQTRG